MNVNLLEGGVYVTLSRRNLEHLLAALDRGADLKVAPTLHRMTLQGFLHVTVEENDDHYLGRPEGSAGLGLEPYLA